MSATSISQSGTVSLTFYNSVAGLYLKHILTVMSLVACQSQFLLILLYCFGQSIWALLNLF